MQTRCLCVTGTTNPLCQFREKKYKSLSVLGKLQRKCAYPYMRMYIFRDETADGVKLTLRSLKYSL